MELVRRPELQTHHQSSSATKLYLDTSRLRQTLTRQQTYFIVKTCDLIVCGLIGIDKELTKVGGKNVCAQY